MRSSNDIFFYLTCLCFTAAGAILFYHVIMDMEDDDREYRKSSYRFAFPGRLFWLIIFFSKIKKKSTRVPVLALIAMGILFLFLSQSPL